MKEFELEKILKKIESEKTEHCYFCPQCNAIKNEQTIITDFTESYTIKGEEYNVTDEARFCKKCGAKLSDAILDDIRLNLAYSEYREKHKMLKPEEITAIYKKYGLTAKSLAKVLGFGDHTIYRYEKGALQEKSHDAILKFIQEPSFFITYLQKNEILIADSEFKKLMNRLKKIIREEIRGIFEEIKREQTIPYNKQVKSAIKYSQDFEYIFSPQPQGGGI